jgi:hypothetical protein
VEIDPDRKNDKKNLFLAVSPVNKSNLPRRNDSMDGGDAAMLISTVIFPSQNGATIPQRQRIVNDSRRYDATW